MLSVDIGEHSESEDRVCDDLMRAVCGVSNTLSHHLEGGQGRIYVLEGRKVLDKWKSKKGSDIVSFGGLQTGQYQAVAGPELFQRMGEDNGVRRVPLVAVGHSPPGASIGQSPPSMCENSTFCIGPEWRALGR